MARRHAPHAATPVADIVSSPDVAGLVTRAGKLADLGARLNRVLPSALAAKVQLANLRERKLVFIAASPVWATRLHYAQTSVLEAARQLGLDVRGVVVKVAAVPAGLPAQAPARPLSETAAKHLALAAKLLA